MKEAKITCLCSEIFFKDLNLSMRKGEVRWISEMEAQKSSDLRRVSQLGAVKLEFLSRSLKRLPHQSLSLKEKRVTPKPFSQPPPPKGVPRVEVGPKTISLPRPVSKPPQKEGVLEDRIKSLENNTQELKDIIMGMHGSIISGMERQEKLLSGLESRPQVFTQAPINSKASSERASNFIVESEPEEMFIPSNLVPESSLEKPKEETSEGGGLDDSAQLLKSMRKKKRVKNV